MDKVREVIEKNRKPALQQLHEELEQCGKRLMEYKESKLFCPVH